MSTNAISISLGQKDLTGESGLIKNLITSATANKEAKEISLTGETSLALIICEAIQIQPILFFVIFLATTGVFIDLTLFVTKNNYLLHPYIDFGILIAGIGLINTFLTGGRVISEIKENV